MQYFLVLVKCLTNGGDDPNRECKFPFVHKGTTYRGCPPDPILPGKTWCSTKVDENGNHVVGQNKWGYCSPSCPKHTGMLL